MGAALALAAGGCGSSGSASSASTSPGAGTQGAGAASTSANSVRVTTTPKYGAPSSSEAPRSGTVQIDYRNITIHPDTLRVRAGTTVRWVNEDNIEHNVTSQSGPQRIASGGLREGQSFAVRLQRPGVVHYVCTIHPASMNGTIEVLR